jgi:hypothetical protein
MARNSLAEKLTSEIREHDAAAVLLYRAASEHMRRATILTRQRTELMLRGKRRAEPSHR